ncbi:uncharacterized protein L969DRAFT_87695 [Mixia osmundae IAM 14324]|uniref:Mediator of RNA polymerase II transcription subunit 14 n=1 Tax=Mixia osmundae (strain CBS 9802 / IAM 14324 / JCM 22182 / KY 12970) TaxID=764103 RepID=G7E440_MIXOS|nr:uncharacterized protein L969DRAFT_87695 [Mixia osmundae IAM 14324]KEI39695.1 hypothetical protein L969DRAFT_87695 [Mixia osmundae IAM 14324]GAA97600.1 hypothetical protein E5Q_04278 [Mixia osmundae IAM 14324]
MAGSLNGHAPAALAQEGSNAVPVKATTPPSASKAISGPQPKSAIPAHPVSANGTDAMAVAGPSSELTSKQEEDTPMTRDPTAELPIVGEDLCYLGRLMEGMATHVFKDLQNLVEVLPSKDARARPRAIIEFVLSARQQLIKLLVLLRWSEHTDGLQRAINVIAFLQDFGYEFKRTDQILTTLIEDESIAARVRKYDLTTAIDLLTTGSYRRLPKAISAYAEAEYLDDQTVLSVMERMTRKIRYRLAVATEIPDGMRVDKLDDGKVTLSVAGLFEVVLTLGPINLNEARENTADDEDIDQDGEEQRWYVLDVRWLYDVYNSSGEPIPLQAKGKAKDDLVDLTNIELARDCETTDDAAALQRLFEYLNRTALCHKLVVLHADAMALSRTPRGSGLASRLSQDRQQLVLEYWRDHSNARDSKKEISHSSIILSVDSNPSPTATSRLRKHLRSPDAPRLASLLRTEWRPDGPTVIPLTALEVLDGKGVDDLLKVATLHHARMILRQIMRELGEDVADDRIEDDRPALHIKLAGSAILLVSVDQQSGRVHLRAQGDVPVRLRTYIASDARTLTAESLANVKTIRSVIARSRRLAVEGAIDCLDWHKQPGSLLDPSDHDISGRSGCETVLIALPDLADYLLSIACDEQPEYRLLQTRPVSIEREISTGIRRVLQAAQYNDDEARETLALDHLASIYEQCRLRATTLCLQHQLHARALSYQVLTQSICVSIGALPYLRQDMIWPNMFISVRLSRQPGELTCIAFQVKLRAKPRTLTLDAVRGLGLTVALTSEHVALMITDELQGAITLGLKALIQLCEGRRA